MTKIKTRLIYLGVIPFLIFAGLSLTEIKLFNLSPNTLFIGYSVIILNFVLGTLWHNTSSWANIPTSIWTNVIALLSFVFLFSAPKMSLIGLAGCFIFSYFLELKSATVLKSSSQRYYLSARLYITSVVVLCHLTLLVPHFIE